MQLHLIRHTTPDVEKGVCYGHSDIFVKDTFEEEAKCIINNLPSSIKQLYSSPSMRCSLLANRISTGVQLQPIFDKRLMELNFGKWEMKRWNDINSAELNEWMNDYVTVKCPGGESYRMLQERVHHFLEEVKQKDYMSVAVVTHAGVIKILDAIINQKDEKDAMAMKVDYGQIISYVI